MENAEIQYLLNPDAIIDEGVQKLKLCKEQIMNLIGSFFDNVEEYFKKLIHSNKLKATDFH